MARPTPAELEVSRQIKANGAVRRCANCGNIVLRDKLEHFAPAETRCRGVLPYLASY